MIELRVRAASLADVPAMLDLEQQSSSAAHWSTSQYEAFFVSPDQQFSRHTAIVAEDASELRREPAKRASPEIVAFLVARKIDFEWEVENIVVGARYQRRGIGFRLLGQLIEIARQEKSRGIFLEVRESNHSARALYSKAGFRQTGVRTGYYSCPAEDAILYSFQIF